MYPEDANHGFHNNTTPRYDEDAAELAWQRTIDFFNEKVKVLTIKANTMKITVLSDRIIFALLGVLITTSKR